MDEITYSNNRKYIRFVLIQHLHLLELQTKSSMVLYSYFIHELKKLTRVEGLHDGGNMTIERTGVYNGGMSQNL